MLSRHRFGQMTSAYPVDSLSNATPACLASLHSGIRAERRLTPERLTQRMGRHTALYGGETTHPV